MPPRRRLLVRASRNRCGAGARSRHRSADGVRGHVGAGATARAGRELAGPHPLAQTGCWFRRLGRLDGLACRDPGFEDVGDRLEETPSGFGQLTAVRHAAVMTETPPHWVRPTVPLGTHAAAWP